jgi:hypothetical protein
MPFHSSSFFYIFSLFFFLKKCSCIAYIATFNDFSVIWWRSVIIGGIENPDTLYMYNAFGGDPRPFAKKKKKKKKKIKNLKKKKKS